MIWQIVLIYVVMGVGLIAYVASAGADFGGGVWDLLATGERKGAQREAIVKAIAPIWEANHVWLIFLVVLMFTVFPKAFSLMCIALHIPLLFALVGIVLRGAAFVFRAYGMRPDKEKARWGQVFAWSSALTPVFLGAILGAMSTGAIRLGEDGVPTTGYLAGWLSPFAILVGLFALALFALLAAVYLTNESEGALREDFKRRALITEAVAGVLAALVAWRAAADAPILFETLTTSVWTWPVQGATAAAAATVIAALLTGRFKLARLAVITQVALVVLGWGLAMDGHLFIPDLHIYNSGTNMDTLGPLLPALAIGGLLLAPAMVVLFRVFKR